MEFLEKVNFELWSHNENAELAKFLEKVNSSQEKMTKATSFEKKSSVKSFNHLTLKNLPKYEEKELFPKIEDA